MLAIVKRFIKNLYVACAASGDNGVLAGNNWQSSSVEVAVVDAAAARLSLVLGIEGNYWFLTRP